MFLVSVMFLFSVICAWIMAKVEEEQKKNEMAWKLLALRAVEELYKQKKKRDGEADDFNDRASD